MRYIRKYKIFESSSRDKEILDTIRDILVSLKVDHSIRVFMDGDLDAFIRNHVEEFGKVRITFIIDGEIGLDEVLTISHLDSYLRSEEIESAVIATGTDTSHRYITRTHSNKKDELYVVVQKKHGQLTQYPISKLIKLLSNNLNKEVIGLTRIDFQYYLPDYLRYYNGENVFKPGNLIEL